MYLIATIIFLLLGLLVVHIKLFTSPTDNSVFIVFLRKNMTVLTVLLFAIALYFGYMESTSGKLMAPKRVRLPSYNEATSSF